MQRMLRAIPWTVARMACLAGVLIAPVRAQDRANAAKADGPPAAFRVGGASADIMPGRDLPNYNGNLLKHDPAASPLTVQAVVLSDGATRVAIVSIDCTFIGRETVLRIRDALRCRLGLEPDHVCVAATHSHASPATVASFLSGALPDPRYLDLVVERTCEAVAAAASRAQPARMAAASVAAPPLGVCRRRISPQGQAYMAGTEPDAAYVAENAIDENLGFVVFESPEGKPLAAILAIGCHNCMVAKVYSADFFGRAREALRAELGDIAIVTLAAPCGDVSFRQPGGKATYASDRAAGKAIADVVLKALPSTQRRDGGKLAAQSVVERIPDRRYDPAEFVYDGGRGANRSAVEFHQRRYAPEEIAVRERGSTHCDVELQAIAMGRVAIVTNPAELFSVFGLRIREASPFDVTLVASLASGYCGYVPTLKSFEHRGYETYRTVYTSRLVKDGGDRIQKESIELLQAMAPR